MDAVITAGGRISGEFAEKAKVTIKALIDIDGKPVISRVVDAVRGIPEVRRVFVIGPEELKSSPLADADVEIIPETPDGSANFMLGLERCSTDDGCRVLFCASDLPFLTSDAVHTFIKQCEPEADFCYPVVGKEQFTASYPDVPVKFETLRDGCFTGGCVFLVNPKPLLSNQELIRRIFSSRKSPLKMARIMGWKFILGVLTRSLTIDRCVQRASIVIGCRCRAVLDSPPELAYDMDDLDDFEYALRYMERAHA